MFSPALPEAVEVGGAPAVDPPRPAADVAEGLGAHVAAPAHVLSEDAAAAARGRLARLRAARQARQCLSGGQEADEQGHAEHGEAVRRRRVVVSTVHK